MITSSFIAPVIAQQMTRIIDAGPDAFTFPIFVRYSAAPSARSGVNVILDRDRLGGIPCALDIVITGATDWYRLVSAFNLRYRALNAAFHRVMYATDPFVHPDITPAQFDRMLCVAYQRERDAIAFDDTDTERLDITAMRRIHTYEQRRARIRAQIRPFVPREAPSLASA